MTSYISQLFQGKPNEAFLKTGWASDAVFEDPITLTKGYDQFAPQWYGLAKVFSTSDTLAYKVTKFDPNLGETHCPPPPRAVGCAADPSSPAATATAPPLPPARAVEFELRQKYVVKATGIPKTMESLVHIELNEAGQVVRFEDRWDAKPIESGAAGTAVRKLNAKR